MQSQHVRLSLDLHKVLGHDSPFSLSHGRTEYRSIKIQHP